MKETYEYYSDFSYKNLVGIIERQTIRIEKLEYEIKQNERVLQGRDKTIEALKDEVKELRKNLKYEKIKSRD